WRPQSRFVKAKAVAGSGALFESLPAFVFARVLPMLELRGWRLFMKTTSRMIGALVSACLIAGLVELHAQNDPRQVFEGMIYQVSTGTPNPNWYSPQLWQLIAYQTGNSGVYPQLRQLGVVKKVTVTQWVALPGGILYAMTAEHAFGRSYWTFGIGTFSN